MLNSVAGNDVFNNQPAAPAIYGTWMLADVDPTIPPVLLTFLADGNYMHSQTCDDPALTGFVVPGGLLGSEPLKTGAGLELGPYTWDSVTGDLTANPVIDANGWCGLNDTSNGNNNHTITVSGDVLTITNPDGTFFADRLTASTSPIVGSWALNSDPNSPVVLAFFANGYYEESQTAMNHELSDGTPAPVGDPALGASYIGGMEYGNYSWSDPDLGGTGALTGSVLVDTDGWSGLHSTNDGSASINVINITIDGDVMTLSPDGESPVNLYRIQ